MIHSGGTTLMTQFVTYDDYNLTQTISTGGSTVAQYSYTHFNTVDTITYPDGFTSYTYDNAMQVVSATNRLKNNTAISQYSYQYDKLGNQIKKTDNGQITQYTYDALSRLQSVTEPDGTVTAYTFDKNQNIALKELTA